VVDDTALPKQGKHSVGVARQYCGRLGKRANRQVLVSLTLARGEVPVSVSLRLFLPEAWAADPERCARAGVPEERRGPLAKTDVALEEIDRVLAAGVRFGRVVADAGYGISAAFRRGLSERELSWAVGVPKVQNVYPSGVELSWPAARTGRPRKHPVPSEEPVAAEAMLAGAAWRRVSWREPEGSRGGPLAAEFAALRVRPAEGAQLRNGWHLPGAEVWLVGERRPSGERKYYLSNLPAAASLQELAATIKARPRPATAGRSCGGGSMALPPMGVRAGAPAAQGGAGPRPLRGPELARAAPPRPAVPARLRLPAAPAAPGAGGKAAPGHPDRHLGRRCPRCAAASWPR
jgi:SRSO17 transposase